MLGKSGHGAVSEPDSPPGYTLVSNYYSAFQELAFSWCSGNHAQQLYKNRLENPAEEQNLFHYQFNWSCNRPILFFADYPVRDG